jgi:hypothetical protein
LPGYQRRFSGKDKNNIVVQQNCVGFILPLAIKTEKQAGFAAIEAMEKQS